MAAFLPRCRCRTLYEGVVGIGERVVRLLCSDRHRRHRDGESASVLVVVVEEVEACFDEGPGIAFEVVG